MTLPELADMLQRLTNTFPPDSDRKTCIAMLKAGDRVALPYARSTLQRIADNSNGIPRSIARKTLREFPS